MCDPDLMLRQIVVALLLTVWFSPPPARAGAPAAEHRPSTRPAPGTAAEVQQLAQRERNAQALESFEGGGRGTIATSSVVIILLLVIILILII
jgi:hypothetical protein